MQIREATKSDIAEIVQVLKMSLGETDLPLSEEIWNYKHVNNPFGESLVLVAEENNKIIGLRAFMRWQWTCNTKIYNTFRAVDTATHPQHQGKGVFKKLTLKAVELAKKEGDHFVFNTPNDQSRPGYLKMGWEVVDNIVVSFQPGYRSFWKLKSKGFSYKVDIQANDEDLKKLCSVWNSNLKADKKIFTSKTPAFLKWRYQNNPLQDYEVLITKQLYLAGHVKNRGKIKELRISECIFVENKTSKHQVQKIISSWASKFSVQIATFSPGVTTLMYPSKKGKYGPVLTLKNLNLLPEENKTYKNIENWKYSLGDLELF